MRYVGTIFIYIPLHQSERNVLTDGQTDRTEKLTKMLAHENSCNVSENIPNTFLPHSISIPNTLPNYTTNEQQSLLLPL